MMREFNFLGTFFLGIVCQGAIIQVEFNKTKSKYDGGYHFMVFLCEVASSIIWSCGAVLFIF